MTFPHASKGFTLVEMMVVVAVLAIMATMAAPSFNTFLEGYRLKRAAETISAFLVNTKSEAIKRNATVRAVVRQGDTGWCLGMTTANNCICTDANACQIDGVDRLVRGGDFKDITLNAPADGHKFQFRPLRGTVTGNETVELESDSGYKMRVVVSAVGRIRLCSPSGSVGGYPTC